MKSLIKLASEVMQTSIFKNYHLQYNKIYYPTQASIIIDNKPCGKCARSVYFEKTNVERQKYSDRTLRTFEFGDMFENMEIKNYQKLGIYVDDHVKFSFPVDNIYISGESDCIVILDGQYVGVEFKTSYGEGFIKQHVKGYKRKPSDLQPHLVNPLQPAPKLDHLLQAGIYLYYFSKVFPKISHIQINQWHLIYFAVDYKIGAEYVLELEENGGLHRLKCKKIYTLLEESEDQNVEEVYLKDIYIEQVFERYKYIENYIQKQVVPPADYDYNNEKEWRCNYCQFKWVCINLPQTECSDSYLNIIRPI